jgi:flagellar biosynthesis protein FlhB
VAETRTQQATARKLAQARAQGDVAISADLVSAALLFLVGLWLRYAGVALWSALRELTREALSGHTPAAALWLSLARPLALLLAPLPLAAWFVVLMQRGLAFGGSSSARRAPAGAAQRLAAAFGPEAWQRFAVALIKLVALAGLLALALRGSLPGVLDAFRRDARELLTLSAAIGESLLTRAALALALIGALDWQYQRWRRARRLRMSRRELIDEQRETEGDPLLRQRRAQGRALLAHASLADLDAAALVIAGAGGAIALRYRPDRDASPSVWIKADAQLAETLLARASALGLPLFVDDTLVLVLQRLEPSEPIPAATYERVAALLTAAGAQSGTRAP